MLRIFVFLSLFVIASFSNAWAASPQMSDELQYMTLNEVVSKAGTFNNKEVKVEVGHIEASKTNVLTNDITALKDGSFLATGHAAWGEWAKQRPTKMIETYYNTYAATSDGPEVRYVKARVTGTFQTGGAYGHKDAYKYLIRIKQLFVLRNGKWIEITQ